MSKLELGKEDWGKIFQGIKYAKALWWEEKRDLGKWKKGNVFESIENKDNGTRLC